MRLEKKWAFLWKKPVMYSRSREFKKCVDIFSLVSLVFFFLKLLTEKKVYIEIDCLFYSSISDTFFYDFSRVFLLRQIWIIKYSIKYSAVDRKYLLFLQDFFFRLKPKQHKNSNIADCLKNISGNSLNKTTYLTE